MQFPFICFKIHRRQVYPGKPASTDGPDRAREISGKVWKVLQCIDIGPEGGGHQGHEQARAEGHHGGSRV